MLAIIEAKRYQHVCDRPAVPVGHDHVDRDELVEIVAARFPALRVVAVAAPIEVADILQRYAITVGAAMSNLRDIVCPEPFVGGSDVPPPDQQCREGSSEAREGEPGTALPQRNYYTELRTRSTAGERCL